MRSGSRRFPNPGDDGGRERGPERVGPPGIAMLAFEDGTSPGGNTVNGGRCDPADDSGVDVIGANVRSDRTRCLPSSRRSTAMVASTYRRPDIPVATMPNAGWPEHIDGRYIFSSSPEYLGRFAEEAAGGRSAHRRRMLRHDAGAHPRDAPRAR